MEYCEVTAGVVQSTPLRGSLVFMTIRDALADIVGDVGIVRALADDVVVVLGSVRKAGRSLDVFRCVEADARLALQTRKGVIFLLPSVASEPSCRQVRRPGAGAEQWKHAVGKLTQRRGDTETARMTMQAVALNCPCRVAPVFSLCCLMRRHCEMSSRDRLRGSTSCFCPGLV